MRLFSCAKLGGICVHLDTDSSMFSSGYALITLTVSLQRADAMRLFFLHKYGGIYIDLDIECRRSLDFLRHYGWVMPKVTIRRLMQSACLFLRDNS